MANKTELKKYVELKMQEAIDKLTKEREEAVEIEIVLFFEEYSGDLDFIKSHILKSSNCLDTLISNIDKSGKGAYNTFYRSPVQQINDLFNEFSLNTLAKHFDINNVNLVNKTYKTKIKECKDEYNNLLAVISSMNAKDGILVLKNLGFDTDNIGEPKQVTALTTNIDSSKLFV